MRWIRGTLVVASAAALLASCTDAPTGPPRLTDSMRRIWQFSTMSLVQQQSGGWSGVGDPRRQQGGTVSDEHVFGPAALDLSDGEATGKVSSGNSGFRHFVSAEAPYEAAWVDSNRAIAGRSQLRQFQRFVKTRPEAELTYAVTTVNLEGIETDRNPITEFECPWMIGGEPSIRCERLLWSWVTLDIDVMRVPLATTCAELDETCLFRASGRVDLYGSFDNWKMQAMGNALQPVGVWSEDDFRLDVASHDDLSHARVRLNGPIVMDIPLNDVGVGDTIQVSIIVDAAAMNHRQTELESFIFAHLAEGGGAAGLEFAHRGLEPIETPPEPEGPTGSVALQPVRSCGAGHGGTVQFSSTSFSSPEWPVGRAPVVLQRTGGIGPMSVRISTSPGTATADVDYTELDTYVYFDGDADESRAIDITILGDDIVEGSETLEVQLSDPACGEIGSISTATFTIYDDDREVAPHFSVSGTVHGLVGSGLRLSNLGRQADVASDGVFAFPGGWAEGTNYDVAVVRQPASPAQVCTVANGTGTIGTQDVENVTVTCTTIQTDGNVDTDFGDNGFVWTDIVPNTEFGFEAEIKAHNGGILAAGRLDLTRYNPDGTRDNSFGSNGIAPAEFFGRNTDDLYAVEVLSDGRILVAGRASNGANSSTNDEFALARLNADGTRDISFGNGGFVVTDFDGWADAAMDILVQQDGSIVLVGIAYMVGEFGATNAQMALARYTSNGVLDTSFGPDASGMVTQDIVGGADVVNAGTVMPDGRILVVGRASRPAVSMPDYALAMFSANGTLDTTFGEEGILHAADPDDERLYDVTVDAAGRIVVVGEAAASALILRFDSNGNPDASFGSAGRLTDSRIRAASGVALDDQGRIVITGGSSGDYGALRVLPNGTPDADFGDNGLVTADFFGGFDSASDVLILPDGGLVLAGVAPNGLVRRVGLVRILP